MLRLVDQVGRGEPVEDTLVELKAGWIAPTKAARRLAGHANAARGQDILWVIGLDESRGVVGAEARERSAWWSSVQAEFDDVPPDLTDLNVLVGGKTVVALHFKTDRAPYVVKNPAYGSAKGDGAQFEVPWRAGTAIRSARREDLVRLLVPVLAVPQLDWLSCHVWSKHEEGLPPDQRPELPDFVRGEHLLWRCGARLYVTPMTSDRIVLPTHLCAAEARERAGGSLARFDDLHLYHGAHFAGVHESIDSATIFSTSTETIVDGPGVIELNGYQRTEPRELPGEEPILFDLVAGIAAADRSLHGHVELHPTTAAEGTLRWEVQRRSNVAG